MSNSNIATVPTSGSPSTLVSLLVIAILVQWCWSKLDQRDDDEDNDDVIKIVDPETTQTTADSSPTIQKRSAASSDTNSNADEDTGEVWDGALSWLVAIFIGCIVNVEELIGEVADWSLFLHEWVGPGPSTNCRISINYIELWINVYCPVELKVNIRYHKC